MKSYKGLCLCGAVVVWCGVEVELDVRHPRATVVVVQHAAQIADPHVVGLDCEV